MFKAQRLCSKNIADAQQAAVLGVALGSTSGENLDVNGRERRVDGTK
jgi:hypothetical protein